MKKCPLAGKVLPLLLGFLLTSVAAYAMTAQENKHPETQKQRDCDSLFLSNKKAIAVKNLMLTKEEVSFSYCDDTTSRTYTAPWMQVNYIKKADGTIMDSPFKKEADDMSPHPDEIEKEVDRLMVMAIISIPATLLVVGLFLSVAVLIVGKKYKKKVAGHPKEQQLRKKIKRAMWVAAALPLTLSFVAFCVIIWGIIALSNWNNQ